MNGFRRVAVERGAIEVVPRGVRTSMSMNVVAVRGFDRQIVVDDRRRRMENSSASSHCAESDQRIFADFEGSPRH